MIIIGIDPGTARLGYGIIEKNKGKTNKFKAIDYGCITTKANSDPGERLKIINTELNKLIKKHKPQVMAVESVYFFKNLKTALPVSQAKGVILFTAAKKKIPVYEFTPLQVKMIVTGYGRAEKEDVQKKVQALLSLEKNPEDKNKRTDDATDALGIALCYFLQPKKRLKFN